jgi:hypothetical protein
MTPRRKTTQKTMRAADEAIRRDMQTINRAEELLHQARNLTRRIEERVRKTLRLDPGQDRQQSP